MALGDTSIRVEWVDGRTEFRTANTYKLHEGVITLRFKTGEPEINWPIRHIREWTIQQVK